MRKSTSITRLANGLSAALLLASAAAAPDADLLFRQGKVPEAVSAYRAALQADPRNVLAREGLANALNATGLRAQAAQLSAPEIDSGFQLKSPYRHYQLPCRPLLKGGRFTGLALEISVNGVKSDLRLDTGAGGVTVSNRFAARAGIHKIADSKGWGIGSQDPADTWIGQAASLRIGDLEFSNVTVKVSGKTSLDSSGGLIGTDIFKRFLVKLNFAAHQCELDPLFGPAWDGSAPVDRYTGPETAGFQPIVEIYHYLLMPTKVSGQDSLFLVDTGARFNSISTNLARTVATVRKNHHMSIHGVSGKVDALYEADRVVLQFAGYDQPAVDLAAFDLSNISRNAGLEISGILGLPVLSQFQSITIDYRDAAIRFDYKP